MKVDAKPRGFVSLEDAMRELQQRHARAVADEQPPPDQGEAALRVQLPELVEIENTVREREAA